jgi:nitroreductase
MMTSPAPAAVLSDIIRTRRSVRDFLPDPIPPELLDAVLADANWSPSWSNTQPYRIAIASGDLVQRLKGELCERFDLATKARQGGLWGKLKLLATRKGLPDGDFATNFAYPANLQPRRRATGHGLYELLGIARHDKAARNRQMRRNFEFFGAPTVIFLFAHQGLREFSILDTGIFLQTLMLSAQAHGLATCAQGALATWAGPVRGAFAIPGHYRLICGLSIGFASGKLINSFNPRRGEVPELLIPTR